MNIDDTIKALDAMIQQEDDKYILATLNFELGYLTCLHEHNIDDMHDRLSYIQTEILQEGE